MGSQTAGISSRVEKQGSANIVDRHLDNMNPETIVQLQLDAYNARDLRRFLAAYSDEVRIFRPPEPAASIVGKPALAEYYATQRFNLADLNAELVNRMVLGNKVIDHERISGVREVPFEVAAVYEVAEGLIQTVWSFAAG
jgi:hypothetical protein